MRRAGGGNWGCVGEEERGKYDLVGVGRREAKNNPGVQTLNLTVPVRSNARLITCYALCPSAILLQANLGLPTSLI